MSFISQRCGSSELRLLNEVCSCLREGEHLCCFCKSSVSLCFFMLSLNLPCIYLNPDINGKSVHRLMNAFLNKPSGKCLIFRLTFKKCLWVFMMTSQEVQLVLKMLPCSQNTFNFFCWFVKEPWEKKISWPVHKISLDNEVKRAGSSGSLSQRYMCLCMKYPAIYFLAGLLPVLLPMVLFLACIQSKL